MQLQAAVAGHQELAKPAGRPQPGHGDAGPLPGAALAVPDEVVQACTTWDVPAGRLLQAGGPAGDVCYGIRSGMAELVHPAGRASTSTLVDLLEPGQWLGADDLLLPHQAGLAAETVSACSVYVLRRARMLQLMEASPAVRAWLLAAASARIQRMAQRLHALAAFTPEERTRWALEQLVDRFGRAHPLGRTVPLRCTQTQLARLADTSRQKVNQVMVALRREGRLQLVRGRIVVPAGH
jgi:CRP-like cAMP-binding protein